MLFAATFISVLAWLQVFMRWLFINGRNSTQDITGTDVAYKGSRPNPPSAVAVVWAEDKLRDSAIKQLADIIQWCDHDGLETLCVYDPSGDLKSKTLQLQHELSNQDWSIQVGWRAEPIGQELTCDACRAGEQGVAAATPGAARPSAPSTSATLRACADATTSHPGPSLSPAPPPPPASAASAAPTASRKIAADPAAAAAAAAALLLQKAKPATAASCGCRQQPAASVAPCGGGGFAPGDGGAPVGCSAVGRDAPSHGCITAAASPAAVVAEVPALKAAGAATVVAAAAADCGGMQPLQSIPCTSGGSAGCNLCRLPPPPPPPPLAAAASRDLSWRAGAAGGGAGGGEQPQPGHPPHQAANGAAVAVAGATDCRLPCAGDSGSALAADSPAAAIVAASMAAGACAACAVGQVTMAAGALGCPHHGGLNGQALLEPSGAGGQEGCARRSPAYRLSSVGPSGGYDDPAAAAAARCSTGTSTAVDRSKEGDRRWTAGSAEAAAGGAGGTGAAARRVRRLHVLSAEDGYAPVLRAAAAGGVCCRCGAVTPLKAGPYREGLARLRNQMAQLAGPAVLVQPELVLVVGPVLSLAGFSPLAVATSEILHLGPAVGMCRARVDAALAKFLRTEQRFGS